MGDARVPSRGRRLPRQPREATCTAVCLRREGSGGLAAFWLLLPTLLSSPWLCREQLSSFWGVFGVGKRPGDVDVLALCCMSSPTVSTAPKLTVRGLPSCPAVVIGVSVSIRVPTAVFPLVAPRVT